MILRSKTEPAIKLQHLPFHLEFWQWHSNNKKQPKKEYFVFPFPAKNLMTHFLHSIRRCADIASEYPRQTLIIFIIFAAGRYWILYLFIVA